VGVGVVVEFVVAVALIRDELLEEVLRVVAKPRLVLVDADPRVC